MTVLYWLAAIWHELQPAVIKRTHWWYWRVFLHWPKLRTLYSSACRRVCAWLVDSVRYLVTPKTQEWKTREVECKGGNHRTGKCLLVIYDRLLTEHEIAEIFYIAVFTVSVPVSSRDMN